MTGTDQVRRAGPADAARIAEIFAEAFQDDPVSCWLFPDPHDRAARHPDFFTIFIDRVLSTGEAYTTTDRAGAALWLHFDPHGPPPAEIPEDLFGRACGPNLPRVRILGELAQAGHLHRPRHAYLPFIGVLPDRHGRGLGTALLRHRLAALDAAGVPAYLEASSARSRRLYLRLGFTPLPTTINLPDGPPMYPMWRPARTSGGETAE